MRRGLVAAAVLAALTGCTTTADIISDADRLRREKHLDEALERYREAQERADIGGSEKVQVARARGEIFLEKNDLQNAEQSFRRMPESSGTRAHLLARVALAKGEREKAESLDRDALAKGEPVGRSLAEMVGAEATTPERLLDAAAILAGAGGDADQARAAETAARAWASAIRGETPGPLLAKVEGALEKAPRYPSLELVRCDLLLRAQSPKAEEAFVALASFTPKPSAAFLERASAIHASGAARSGNASELETALKGLPREAAASRRAEIARALEASGDWKGALDVWKRTADAGGPPGARALCEIARIEELRGRHAEATAALEKARAEKEPDLETRALLALARAKAQDPLGARATLEEAARTATVEGALRADAARLARAAQHLAEALEAVAGGDPAATALAQASVAAGPEVRPATDALAAIVAWQSARDGAKDPGEPARTLAKNLLGSPASGATRAALVRASVARLLTEACVDEALAPAAGLEDREAVCQSLETLGPAALAELLAHGPAGEAAKLFAALKAKDLVAQVPELAGRVRGDAAFAALWSEEAVTAALGPPDPLARRAPYVCRLVLAGGESLGPVRVVHADEAGLEVELPGEPGTLRIAKERLTRLSAHGLAEADFERAARAAREERP